MQRKKLLSLYGLKWNPFTPEVPDDGLFTTARIESFAMRIETMVPDGGFALITGEPGYGKSIALRIIEQRLCELPEVSIGVLARPQSGVADFYRELGDLFAVELRPHNRWAGFKTLRERWKAHAQASLLKPAILIDEAQDMPTAVLSELRILSSGKSTPRPTSPSSLPATHALPIDFASRISCPSGAEFARGSFSITHRMTSFATCFGTP